MSVGTVTVVAGRSRVPGTDAQFLGQAAVGILKFAALIKARGLNVTGGLRVNHSAKFCDNALAVAAGLKRLAEEAARLEPNLNIEVLYPHGLCRTFYQAEFLVDRVFERNVHILFRFAVGQLEDGYAQRAVRRLAGRVGNMQLGDASCGNTVAGRGNVDPSLGPSFKALYRGGFHGYVTLEVDCAGDLDQDREHLRRARQLVYPLAEGPVDVVEDLCWKPE